MTPTAIFEKRDDEALHLLPGSTFPEPLRGNLEQNPIPLEWDWFVAISARLSAEMTVILNNHAKVPGAAEAGFTWARFVPTFHPKTGKLSGVRAWYE